MKLFNSLFEKITTQDKKRIIKNFNSNIINNFARVLVQLFFPLLMIKIYGLEAFGIWIFLISLPDLFYILNLDFNSATKTEISIFHNQNKLKKVKSYFINFAYLNYLIFIIFLPLTLLIISNINIQIEFIKKINTNDIDLILFLIISSFFLNFIISVLDVGISFKGNLYISNNLNSFFDIFSKILILLFGLYNNSILYASIAYFTSNIIKVLCYYIYFKLENNKFSLFSTSKFNIHTIIKIFKLSLPYYLISISTLIKHSYQIIIIGIFFGPNIVGLISTLKTLFYFLPIRVWSIVQRSIIYEFTKLYSKNNFFILKKKYILFIKICLFFSLIFLFFSFLFGANLYNFWIGNKYLFYSKEIIYLIVLDVVFYIIANSFNHLQKAINRFYNFSLFLFFINLFIIFIIYLSFAIGLTYFNMFIFNLIGSFSLAIFSVYEFKKSIKYNFNHKK